MTKQSKHTAVPHSAHSATTTPSPSGCRTIRALVEGYEDVAFWRSIFDPYESDSVRFEVSVPQREDLAKGKKTLLGQADKCHPELIMCMDSDFDYLFANQTHDARIINSSPYLSFSVSLLSNVASNLSFNAASILASSVDKSALLVHT